MDIMFLINGFIIGFTASIPLGPIGLICIQRTINGSLKNGFVSGLGASLADTFFAIVAAFGITAIHTFIEEQQLYLRIIGGSILVVLGLKFFLTNPTIQTRKQNKNGNLWTDFVSVFFLTLSNPLTVFVFGAVFAGFGIIPKDNTWFEMLELVMGIFFGALCWWILLVNIVNFFRDKFRLRRLWWLNKIVGAIITIFGFIALISVAFIKFY
jgi:threonine/homoserine/homoserine lactone efflux protein